MKKEKVLLPADRSRVRAPWFWIGTWSMGGEGFGKHDSRESLRVLRSAIDSGLTHFDTAGFYAHGRSEELLSKAIAKKRNEVFISSKGGLVWDGKRVGHRGSPKELEEQLHNSLRRLGTDYLDLFQLHWPDPEVPVSESLDALKEFKVSGLIRYWGVGNLGRGQVERELSGERNIAHQVHFNPLHRSDDVLAEGRRRCINCITSPLEQGLLGSGKSSRGDEGISAGDFRNRNPKFMDQGIKEWNRSLDAMTGRGEVSKVFAVLTWICSRPNVHTVIPGPRKLEQLEELVNVVITAEEGGLMSGRDGTSVMSSDRAKEKVPSDIWKHLSEGPS